MLVGKPKPFCSNGQSVCAASGSDPQGTRFGKAEKRRCARQADKRGTTCGFLPLVNHPLSLFSTRRTGRAAPLLRTGTAAKIVRGAEAENGSRRRYRLFPPEKWVHPVWRGCRESQHTPNSRACKIVAFTRTESASQTSVAPPPPGRARNAADATLSHRKFFHYMWNKFGCGRGQPRTSLGGGDWQEGENPPLLPARRAGERSRRPQAAKSLPGSPAHPQGDLRSAAQTTVPLLWQSTSLGGKPLLTPAPALPPPPEQ